MSESPRKKMAVWKKVVIATISVAVGAYVVGMFLHKEIRTEIDIAAPPEAVWQHLTAFEKYPDWNPFIKKLSGERKVGGQLSATIAPPDGDPMEFSPRVLVFEQDKELRWLGRLLIPGLFDGEHYFRIEDLGGGNVRFVHGEQFTGILAVLAWGAVEPGTTKGFAAMNGALKARAEGKP